jgi:hypothetical protein
MTAGEDSAFAALDAHIRIELARAAATYASCVDLRARLAAIVAAGAQDDDDDAAAAPG